jgi:outer membrane protein assembly factor BamB
VNRRKACWGLLLLVAGIAVAGCGVFEDSDKPKISGKRVSILSLDRSLKPDPALSQVDVRLPKPQRNEDWPEAGGWPNHVLHHLALGDGPKEAWSRSAGSGSTDRAALLSPPVVVGSHVFTIDSAAMVTAFDAKEGSRLWQVDVTPEDAESKGIGGGIAYADGRLFVTTGFAQVIALDAADGRLIWRQSVVAPLRSPPTVADGRVFAVTIDNQLEVLAADDGRRLWNHTATPEPAGLVGGGSPAVEGEVVVVPYSSGELVALKVQNGRVLWSDNLAAARRTDALSALADIRGRPVIDRGRVFAVSHSGRMVAIDLRTGERVWDQEIGGSDMPWVAGDFIYVLTNEAELVCLTRADGRIRWVSELPRYEDLEKKRDPLRWSGPLLAGDRLIAVASNGEALSYSPYTGAPLGRIELPEGAYLTPIVAGETLYVLTDDAELVALR